MSYILDALKKAESERNLGAVPNVYANASHAIDSGDSGRWKKILPWSLTAIALGIALIMLAWLQPWHTQSAAVTPLAAAAAPASPAPAVAMTPPLVAPAEPASTDASPPVMSETATVATATPSQTEEKPVSGRPVPAAITKPAAPASEKKVAEAPQIKKDKPVAGLEQKPEPKIEAKAEPKPEGKTEARADGSDVGLAKDLPQAIQSQLPAISVNGYLYVKDPADRSVLMNQKLLREGDTVAPDLMLEKLLPRGAILNYKGYRYRIAF